MIGPRKGASATQRERARELRREAYRRAKAARDDDPRYLAMKQAAKEQRRAAYRAAKERHAAALAEERARGEIERSGRAAEQRAAFDRALMQLVRRGAKPP